MGGFDLVQYIRSQLSKGFTSEQIRFYLLSYGYPELDVNRALQKAVPQGLRKESGANPKLVEYIRTNVTLGYDIESIMRYLYQYGYTQDEVMPAITAVQGTQHVHHTIDISARTIFLVIVISVSIGLIAGGTYFFMTQPSTPKLLDYQVVLDRTEVLPGESLYFTNRFVNIGDKPKYDIFVEYSVHQKSGGATIYSSGETIGVDDVESSARSIQIPSGTKPGVYRLDVAVSYGSFIANSYADFTVNTREATCNDAIQNQDETGVDCGGSCRACTVGDFESCVDGVRNQDETDIDCGGRCLPCQAEPSCTDHIRNQGETGIDCGGPCIVCRATCTDREQNQDETGVDCGGSCPACSITPVQPDNAAILAKVRDLGTNNEKESVRLCTTITDLRLTDDCYLEVSRFYNTSIYCRGLKAASKANICYMYFVQQGDYTVCDMLTEVHTRRICESLRQINTIIVQQNLTVNLTAT
jgi:hypothetical protein